MRFGSKLVAENCADIRCLGAELFGHVHEPVAAPRKRGRQVVELALQHRLHQFCRDRFFARLLALFEGQLQVQLNLQRCAQLGRQHVDRIGRKDVPWLGLVACQGVRLFAISSSMAVFKREPLQLSIKLPQCRQEIDHLTSADRQAIIASCPCGAAQWLLHCASLGNANAQTNYANMLAAGKGVAQNHANALEWYRRAADLGHAKSMTKLGQLSRLDGVGRGARTTF